MHRVILPAVLLASMWVGPEALAARTEVIFYYGNGGYNSASSGFHTQMRAAGASRSYATGSWPSRSNQNNAKVWLLVAPNSNWSGSQLTDIKYFVDNGGTMVLVSEWAGFRRNAHTIQNSAAAYLGRNTRFFSVSYDLGCTKRGNRTNVTPFSAGASTLTYAASGGITVGSGGTSLYRRQSASNIIVSEERGVVFMADGNSFGGCTYNTSDQRFWRNLYSGACSKITYYRDADGDTWGNSGSTRSECTKPSGYVTRGGDCNDGNRNIYPGASEKIGDEVDQNCDGRESCYADIDEDGWRTNSVVISSDVDCRDTGEATASEPGIDCDDRRKQTYPGADEYCNSIDDDCDKVIDEDDALDAKTWYRDADLDRYGDHSVTRKACKVPTGYVADDTDCDDSRKETHPGADEYCNGIDDDCDKAVDEDAVDAATWYADSDGDTFGNPDITKKACKVPAGYVADHTDCDDDDKTVHPGATEIPYDGIDQDCDGEDLCDVDIDGYDHPLCGGSDCDDTVDTINPGADEVWYDGLDQDCDGWSDYDADYDGFDSADYEGEDCDDTDDQINPDAEEVWYDGIDQNCDGKSDYDADYDGYDSDDYGGEDCDDDDDTVHPGADEIEDGKDNDCNGVDEDDDSDGDGIPDEVEIEIGTDPFNDDTDGDGVKDGVEVGDDHDSPEDTDGDGTIDALDVDDDGDGILTEVEIGDGPGDEPVDSDSDGTPDYLDTDSDGDGFLDEEEGLTDTDSDGTPDYLDLDSDGDSVPDEDELHDDTDGDGDNDRVDIDDDGDGFPSEVERSWDDPDLDGDGIENYLDKDSDGDGTDDIDEGIGDQDCDGLINVIDANDYDGPCANADAMTYQSGACGGASTTALPVGGASLLFTLFALLGARRRRQSV